MQRKRNIIISLHSWDQPHKYSLFRRQVVYSIVQAGEPVTRAVGFIDPVILQKAVTRVPFEASPLSNK